MCGEDGVKGSVTMTEGADCREELFYALAAAKLPIMELQYEKRSLEDIFLELTEDTQSKVEEESRKAELAKKTQEKESVSENKENTPEEVE